MTRIATILACSLLVAGAAAEAYQGVGSHIRRSTDAPRNLDSNDTDSAIRAANYLGRCVAESRGSFARELLAMELGGTAQVERAERVVSAGEVCMNDLGFQLRADTVTVAGGMAEYYLLDVYRDEDIAAAAAGDAGSAPRNGLEHLGRCVARRNAEGVVALIETEPASDDEMGVVRALVSDLGPCVMAGETVGFTPRVIRAVTAVGLYQLVAAEEEER
ncbi:MAG: hypothetical protein ABR601_04065 [Parasphingopyxis sp.]|nr:hypothetical protein [Sphingomonadales bacterium]